MGQYSRIRLIIYRDTSISCTSRIPMKSAIDAPKASPPKNTNSHKAVALST